MANAPKRPDFIDRVGPTAGLINEVKGVDRVVYDIMASRRARSSGVRRGGAATDLAFAWLIQI